MSGTGTTYANGGIDLSGNSYKRLFRNLENAGTANAIGAAIAQVGGEVDKVYSFEGMGREAALDEAKNTASERAIEAGAHPASIDIVEIEEVPLAYLPSNAIRIRVKAVGDLRD